MKIELKLTADELQYMDAVFKNISNVSIVQFKAQKQDRRVVLSILVDVADKVAAMFKKLSRKTTLFDTAKKHKLTLAYHEAYAVNTYLVGAKNSETDAYRLSMASKLSLQLDQKLQ